MGKSWHILRVASGAEVRIASQLGLPAYVPHRHHSSFNRRHRRVVSRMLPALPGMIFVRVPYPREAGTLFPGVLGWMRDGTRSYIALSDGDYQDMRSLERDFWRVSPPSTSSPPRLSHRVGDRISFGVGHVFEGHDAIIERLKGNRALFRLLVNGLVVEADLKQVA